MRLRTSTRSDAYCPDRGSPMRGFVSAAPWGRSEARYALATVAVVVGLALLFVFPAPKRVIQAQVRVVGLDEAHAATVTVTEGHGASLQWISDDEALLTATVPRDALITLFFGQDTLTFTLHELIMYGQKEWATAHGQLNAEILGGKVVDWHPNLLQEAHIVLYDNRFVIAILAAFSLAYVYVRAKDRYRHFAPFLIILSFLAYQILFFLNLTPTLYWDTPLSDPFVRACLIAQMVLSILLVVLWFPLRGLVGRARPDLLDLADRVIDRYGLVILVLIPLLQHLIGHGVFGYNLQPTDARYTYMDWGRAMLQKGFLPFLSRGLLRRMETPLLAAVWAIFYKIIPRGYVVSALVPFLYFEMVVVCTYLLAKELFGHRVGFVAGLFISLSPLFSFASYFVMNDVPSAAMTVLTLYLFVLALKRKSVPLAVVSGVSLLFTMITKLNGVYCAFLILLIYFVSTRRNRKILFITLSFLVFLPIAYVAPYFLRHGLTLDALEAGREHLVTWAKRPMFQIRDGEPADWNDLILGSGQIHYYMGPSNTLFYFQYLVNAIGFPIFFWGVMILVQGLEAALRGFKDRVSSLRADKRNLLAVAIWIFPLLLFLSLWSMRNTRFSYIAFPAYAILGGYGYVLYTDEARFKYSRRGTLLLGLSVIMLSTQSLAHYYNVSYLRNADYRDPIFIETSEPYYYIHRHYHGWYVGWNGAGTDHHFTGVVTTDGRFDGVEPFELETYPDVLEVSDSNTRISFDTMSRSGEDGCEFDVEEGSWVTFDLMIDGTRRPERVFIYAGSIGMKREVASSLPLTLTAD